MPAVATGDQLADLLVLIKQSDSVELKLTVPESDQRSTAVALGMDPLEAQIRQVVFFDTPDLALDAAGVVVRARPGPGRHEGSAAQLRPGVAHRPPAKLRPPGGLRVQGRNDDSAVKLRPVVPHDLPDKLRRSGGFRVEVDALPGGFVCSATMKGALRPTEVRAALAGELPVRKLFSKEQRSFFKDHA